MQAGGSAVDHASQTRFSSPGAFAHLLDPVPTEPAALSEVARNVIVHYWASGEELPPETRSDINLRWVQRLLAVDQTRHKAPLTAPRPVTARAQGCCRDHTMFCVSGLRAHGVPARSRVGFAGYFVDGWHHDHVIVEAWLDGSWRRFDPELAGSSAAVPDPTDMAWTIPDGSGFISAANAWLAYRRGDLDADIYGVDPDRPLLRGPQFLFDEVIIEIAHRFGDELLLWDGWGRMSPPGEPISDEDASWLDAVAALLAEADKGDAEAEQRAHERYVADAGLHPGSTVVQASPFGDPLQTVDITQPPEE